MSRPRLFISPERIRDNHITIDGADVNHIKNVLRLRVGDELVLSDSTDFEYQTEITEIDSSKVVTTISMKTNIEIVYPQVTLLQAISKGTRMDTIVRQATELGVSSIVPIVTSRTIVRLDEKKRAKKQIRWQKIAKEAAEQSQRSSVPKVIAPISWDETLGIISSFDLIIAFWEDARQLFSETVFDCFKADLQKSCGIIIGPEGGFPREEIVDMERCGAHIVSLGRQVLRVDTATTVALGIVFYELEKLGGLRA